MHKMNPKIQIHNISHFLFLGSKKKNKMLTEMSEKRAFKFLAHV